MMLHLHLAAAEAQVHSTPAPRSGIAPVGFLSSLGEKNAAPRRPPLPGTLIGSLSWAVPAPELSIRLPEKAG
jgi:hypothetical protein